MKIKYVYKCVRIRSQDTYQSCSPPSWEMALNYRLGMWTKAYNGTPGVFVFTTLERAKTFASSGLVLRCEYAGEPLRLTRRMDLYDTNLRGYKSLVSIFSTPEKRKKMIERTNSLGFSRYNMGSPFDTYVVNAVKPVAIAYPRKGLKARLSSFVKSAPFNKKLALPDWMHNKWRIKR